MVILLGATKITTKTLKINGFKNILTVFEYITKTTVQKSVCKLVGSGGKNGFVDMGASHRRLCIYTLNLAQNCHR